VGISAVQSTIECCATLVWGWAGTQPPPRPAMELFDSTAKLVVSGNIMSAGTGDVVTGRNASLVLDPNVQVQGTVAAGVSLIRLPKVGGWQRVRFTFFGGFADLVGPSSGDWVGFWVGLPGQPASSPLGTLWLDPASSGPVLFAQFQTQSPPRVD